MFFLFIFAAVLIILGLTVGIIICKNRKKTAGIITIVASLVIGLVLAVAGCVRTVPTGHTGIVLTFGNVENYTYEAGFHITAPWHSVVNMDNRNQKSTVDLACFSSDIQEVNVVYSLNYQIQKSNAQKIYKNIGTSYYTTVIIPRIQEAVKSVIAKYTAETLLQKRAELSTEIKKILTEKMQTYNIEVLDASLENLDFSDAFTDAVEAKQVAEQKSKQAQIEQEQKTMEAEAAAERAEIEANAASAVAIIAAQADFDVAKKQADAAEYTGEKNAEIIGQVRDILAKDPKSLTNDDIGNLILYYYVQKWNGELPETYVGGEDFFKMLQTLVGAEAVEGTVTPVQP